MKLEYNKNGQLVSKEVEEIWWSIGIEVEENVVSIYGENESGNEYFGFAKDNVDGTFEVISYEEILD